MTVKDLAVIAKGLAPVLREYVAECMAALELKEKGADGQPGARGPDGPEGRAGRDGRDGIPGVPGEKGLPGADGRHGVDGLGFDDLAVLHDGERGLTLRFFKGDVVKEFAFTIPAVIYRGVYAAGKTYHKGDMVTWGGAMWHCEKAGVSKPEERSGDWKLAVKQGRDGKDGRDAVASIPVVSVGRPT